MLESAERSTLELKKFVTDDEASLAADESSCSQIEELYAISGRAYFAVSNLPPTSLTASSTVALHQARKSALGYARGLTWDWALKIAADEQTSFRRMEIVTCPKVPASSSAFFSSSSSSSSGAPPIALSRDGGAAADTEKGKEMYAHVRASDTSLKSAGHKLAKFVEEANIANRILRVD